jgi:hypothetical protein
MLNETLKLNSSSDFDLIADTIMNKHIFKVAAVCYRICEIEFYLHSDLHRDTYIHRAPEQASVGMLYFHKRGNSYRGGSFKGLDITFAEGAFGGILIRSLLRIHDNVFIEGPCNCVNEILKSSASESIYDFVSKLDALTINNNITSLEQCANYEKKIYISKRVGLNPTTDHEFAEAPYRFISMPGLIKKQRADMIEGMILNHNMDSYDIKDACKK